MKSEHLIAGLTMTFTPTLLTVSGACSNNGVHAQGTYSQISKSGVIVTRRRKPGSPTDAVWRIRFTRWPRRPNPKPE